MAGLKVYFDLMSQPSRALVLFLKTNQIPFEPKEIALRKGEHMTEEYTKLNPFQKVPVIDDDGFILTESSAILKYLCHKHGDVGEQWYPSGLRPRARVDQFLAWQHNYLHVNTDGIYQHKVIEPRAKNIPVDEAKLQHFMSALETTLDFLENVYLKDTLYLVGDELSIADLLGVCELLQPSICRVDVSAGRPRLAAWMERVRQQLQPHFDDVHQVLYKTREGYLQRQLSRQSSKANM